MNNKKLIRRTKEEVSNLVEFANSLIFKNEKLARENENTATLNSFFDLRNAYFRIEPFNQKRLITFTKLQDEETGVKCVTFRDEFSEETADTVDFTKENGSRFFNCYDLINWKNPRNDFVVKRNRTIARECTDIYLDEMYESGMEEALTVNDVSSNINKWGYNSSEIVSEILVKLNNEDLLKNYGLTRDYVTEWDNSIITNFYADEATIKENFILNIKKNLKRFFDNNNTFLRFNHHKIDTENTMCKITLMNVKTGEIGYLGRNGFYKDNQDMADDNRWINPFALYNNFSSEDLMVNGNNNSEEQVADFNDYFRNESNKILKNDPEAMTEEELEDVILGDIADGIFRLVNRKEFPNNANTMIYDYALINIEFRIFSCIDIRLDNINNSEVITEIIYQNMNKYSKFTKFLKNNAFIRVPHYSMLLFSDEDPFDNTDEGALSAITGSKEVLYKHNLKLFCNELWNNLFKYFLVQNNSDIFVSFFDLSLDIVFFSDTPLNVCFISYNSDLEKDYYTFGNSEDFIPNIPLISDSNNIRFEEDYNNREQNILGIKAMELIQDDNFIVDNNLVWDMNEAVADDFIKSYEEKNEYYIDLLKKVGYTGTKEYENGRLKTKFKTFNGINYDMDFIDAVVSFRMADDHDILYYKPNIIPEEYVRFFMDEYKIHLNYYNKCLHNEGLNQYKRYWNYVNFLVTLMTLDTVIIKKMEVIYDIDYFEEREIRNMFSSYGMEWFDALPDKYRKRILKNLNYLIKNKGTDKSILNIFGIFGLVNGVDGFRLLKYILTKKYKNTEYKGKIIADPNQPYLEFLKANYEEDDLEKIFLQNDRIGYHELVDDDPYWECSEEEVKYEDFNFLNTKYLGLEIGINLCQGFFNATYLFNLLKYMEENDVDIRELAFSSGSKDDNYKYYILDYLYILFYLCMKHYGYKEEIAISFDSILGYDNYFTEVYHFNQDDRLAWSFQSDWEKADSQITPKERELRNISASKVFVWNKNETYYNNMRNLVNAYIKNTGNSLLYNKRLMRDQEYFDLFIENKYVKAFVEANYILESPFYTEIYYNDFLSSVDSRNSITINFDKEIKSKDNTERKLYNYLDNIILREMSTEEKIAKNFDLGETHYVNELDTLDKFIDHFNGNLDMMDNLKIMMYHEDNADRLFTLQKIYDYKFKARYHYKLNKDRSRVTNLKDLIVNTRKHEKLFNYYNDMKTDKAILKIIERIEEFFNTSPRYKDEYDASGIITIKRNRITNELYKSFAARDILQKYILKLVNMFKAYTTQLKDITYKLIYKDPINERVKLSEFMSNFDCIMSIVFDNRHSPYKEYLNKLINGDALKIDETSLLPNPRIEKDLIKLSERTTSLDYNKISDFVKIKFERNNV